VTTATDERELAADCAAAGGIDEAMIARLVRCFYARVREDAVLGPVFAARVHGWEAHFATLADFWSNVILKTRRYDGNPMRLHAGLPIDAAHFAHWLALFGATAREVCPPACAALFLLHATRIAESLQLGLAVARGELPPRRRTGG